MVSETRLEQKPIRALRPSFFRVSSLGGVGIASYKSREETKFPKSISSSDFDKFKIFHLSFFYENKFTVANLSSQLSLQYL